MTKKNGLSKEEFEEQLSALQDRRQQEGKVAPPRRGDSGPMASYQGDRNRLGHQIAEHAAEWMARQPHPLQFDANDLLDCLPDAFALRAGLPVHRQHPISAWASELSFSRLATQLQLRALVSSEFAAAMSHGFSKIVSSTYNLNDEIAPAVLDTIAPDFRDSVFPRVDQIDLQEVVKTGTPEGGSIPLQILSLTGAESGKISTYRARVLISRALLISDSFELVNTMMRQLASQAGRLPSQLLSRIIADNGALADGQPLLGASNTAAAGVNLTGLSSANSILRLATSDAGNVLNLQPAVLLTRPENEITWRSVLRSIELAGQPNIRLVVNSWLPTTSNYSYLLANPAENATFVRMVFAKPLKPSVTSGQLPIEYDGIYLDFSLDFGIKAVSRQGIVRIPAS